MDKPKCPCCSSTDLEETTMGYIGKDNNWRICNNCGFHARVHAWDSIPEQVEFLKETK